MSGNGECFVPVALSEWMAMSCDYRRDLEGKLLVSRRKCDGRESGGSKGFALVCLLTGTDSEGYKVPASLLLTGQELESREAHLRFARG